jgi:hypothetical protein
MYLLNNVAIVTLPDKYVHLLIVKMYMNLPGTIHNAIFLILPLCLLQNRLCSLYSSFSIYITA